MICFALSGCFSAASNITINDDGSVKYEATMVGKDMVKNYIDEIKNEAKQKDDSVQIEPYQEGNMSGYKKTADYSSIEEFATSFSQDDNFKTTIKENKGWFFDAYNFTCIVKGNEEFEKEFGSDQESLMMAKAMMSDCKLGYTINLPYAADKTNADKITNENKTLYWDLASTATSANDKTLEAQFKLWHLEKVVATIVVIVVLVILAGIIYREARVSTNANEVKNKKMLAGGLLLTSLILIGASIYMINKTPTFTDNDIIGKKSVETSKDSGISKDMNKKIPEERSTNAEAVKAGQELKQKGINGEVVASSIGHNSNGYLSLIKDNNQYQIVTNDVKNGVSEGMNNIKDSVNDDNSDDYSATRTASENFFSSNTMWTWIILGVVAAVIIGLIWFYAMQKNNANEE